MDSPENKCINLVHLSSSPGGLEVLLPEIIKGLKRFTFRPVVIRPSPTDFTSVYSALNIEIIYCSFSNLLSSVKLFKLGRKYKNQIFHVFNIGPLFLLVLRLAGVKNLIYSIHGTIYWKNKREQLFRKILWRCAINRKKFIFTSNSEFSGKAFLNKIYRGANIRLLYNPIDLSRFSFSKRGSDTSGKIKKIIYSGRLAKGKGLEKWIKCAIAIHKVYPLTEFEIYGGGPLKSNLTDIISDNHATGYIQLRGHTNYIESVYKEADLLLFLSEYESFGNVVVESILCGTPVITTNIPSMAEIFKNFPAFLINSNDILEEEVLEKIREYSSLLHLCAQAATEFKRRFSDELHFLKLAQIYEEFDT